MTTRGNRDQLALGPGYLYTAILATTEPADLVTPWAEVSATGWPSATPAPDREFIYQLKTSR